MHNILKLNNIENRNNRFKELYRNILREPGAKECSFNNSKFYQKTKAPSQYSKIFLNAKNNKEFSNNEEPKNKLSIMDKQIQRIEIAKDKFIEELQQKLKENKFTNQEKRLIQATNEFNILREKVFFKQSARKIQLFYRLRKIKQMAI